ncbi:MAG: DUF748 domain-containing protein [Methylococcales bacterium]|nr:DUF748 domain-containing protein [Methylococcales bacterium]
MNFRRRTLMLALVGAGLILGYALVGFWLAPYGLAKNWPALSQRYLQRPGHVANIDFNPFTLTLNIEGFSLQDGQDQTLFSFATLHLDLGVWDSLRQGQWVVEALTLEQPMLAIRQDAEGRLNVADLLPEPAADDDDPERSTSAFALTRLAITDAELHYQAKGQAPVALTVTYARLHDLSSTASTPASWSLEMHGPPDLQLTASGHLTLAPLQAELSLDLSGLDLARLATLLPGSLIPVKLHSGQLTQHLQLSYQGSESRLTVHQAETHLEHLNLASAEIGALSATFSASLSGQAQQLKTGWRIAAEPLKVMIAALELKHPDYQASFEKLRITAPMKLDWQPDSGPLHSADVAIQLQGAQMTLPALPLHAALGDLSATLPVSVTFTDTAPALQLQQACLALSDLKLGAPTEPSWLKLGRLAIENVTVDSQQRRLGIGRLHSQDSRLTLTQDSTGHWNGLNSASVTETDAGPATAGNSVAGLDPDLVPDRLHLETPGATDTAETPATPDAPATEPWHITLDHLKLEQYQVSYQDLGQPDKPPLQLQGIALELDDFDSQTLSEALPLRLSATVSPDGHIAANGQIQPQPFNATLAIDSQNLDLRLAQPYLEAFAHIELAQGRASNQGQLQLLTGQDTALQVRYQGDVAIDNLLIKDIKAHQPVIQWRHLGLQQLDFDLARQQLNLARVKLDHPYLRLVIDADRQTNLEQLRVTQANAVPASATPAAPWHYQVGAVTLSEGESDFADYSLILPFITRMTGLEGRLDAFSSARNATANLNLQGKVYDLAEVVIKGQYQPDTGDSEVELRFRNMPLPLVTPYMAEFAGYKIEKGQMALDLRYALTDNQLTAENQLFLDQLTLGEKIDNPKAVSLPLEFAISLLQDSAGQIRLEVPVTGSLDDPQFSLGGIIADALVNTLEKVVTAPFRAIASLFGSDDDLSVISFDPGQASLTLPEMTKLSSLAKAMLARPALQLEIKGHADSDRDWQVLRTQALRDVLEKRYRQQLRAQGEPAPQQLTLTPEQEKQQLAALFIEQFPLSGQYSWLGKPQLTHGEGDFFTIAREKLLATLAVDEQRLAQLASRRAGSIARYLTEQHKVPPERIFLLATEVSTQDDALGLDSHLSLRSR